jgi:co-chaperonin GroES (HSP10)
MIRPLRGWIAIRRDDQPSISPAGIHLLPHVDDGMVKEAVTGEILAVGPGPADGSGMWGLEPGQRVAFSPVLSYEGPEGALLIRRDSVMGMLPC